MLVYIEEAHAQDEWPIRSARYSDSGPVLVDQPRTNEARRELARRFASEFAPSCTLLVDDIENPFRRAFGAWPIRPFLLRDGRVRRVGMPVNGSYDRAIADMIDDMTSWGQT